MRYSLSISSILTTSRALASLHILAYPEEQRCALAEVIMADRPELHRHLAAEAFADMLLSLFPYVSDSNFNESSSDMITLEIPVADTLAPAVASAIRTSLEHFMAYSILHLCLLSLPAPPGRLVDALRSKAECFIGNVVSQLRAVGVNSPFIRDILW